MFPLYWIYKNITRSVSKGELKSSQAPLLILLAVEIGKNIDYKLGKICDKNGKNGFSRISTPLSEHPNYFSTIYMTSYRKRRFQ